MAGRLAAAERLAAGGLGAAYPPPPETTAMGALLAHITGGHLVGGDFQPMNVNYGLLPQLEGPRRSDDGRRLTPPERGRAKKRLMSLRALADMDTWLGRVGVEA